MSEKIFVGGVKVREMNGKNGPWQTTRISFKLDDLNLMAQHVNSAGFVNLNLNRSKKGSEYLEIDTWVKPHSENNYTAPHPGQYQGPSVDPSTPLDNGDVEF